MLKWNLWPKQKKNVKDKNDMFDSIKCCAYNGKAEIKIIFFIGIFINHSD